MGKRKRSVFSNTKSPAMKATICLFQISKVTVGPSTRSTHVPSCGVIDSQLGLYRYLRGKKNRMYGRGFQLVKNDSFMCGGSVRDNFLPTICSL
jgi:hypothetical protein